MPEEEKDVEGKTTETESEETEEKESEETEKTKEQPSEEKEEEKEPEEDEDEEPKKRFPTKQTNEERATEYQLRKDREWKDMKERLKRLELKDSNDDFSDEEDDKPVSRRELEEILGRKDRETASERMLDEFLSENPDYKKYEKKIRKYVNDPDYANVPIGFIAAGIVGENIDDEANERAELKRKADEEAAKTKTGGSTKRGIPGKKKSVWDMSKEEFEQYQTEVLQNR